MKLGILVICLGILCFEVKAEVENIMVRPMSELDGVSLEDLIKMRERSMVYSAFYSYDYEPKIFKRYSPKEKWVGAKYSCYRNEFFDGQSEASIWLNNPNILVHPHTGTLRHMYYGNTNNPVFCMYSAQLMFNPRKIVYDENNKEITVVYKAHNILMGIGSHTFGAIDFTLSPINAFDVGFNYMNVEKSSGVVSAKKLRGMSIEEAKSSIIPLNEDVAVCNPCYNSGYGVCSCYTKKKDINVELKTKNAEIVFKLWREKPESRNDDADFYYRMKFIP